MAWFRHHFSCDGCDGSWLIEAAIVEIADCPFCGTRDVFPYRNEDCTLVIEQSSGGYVVLADRGRDGEPDYRQVGTFDSRQEAQNFIAARRLKEVGKEMRRRSASPAAPRAATRLRRLAH